MLSRQLKVRDMTSGNIYKHIMSYSVPVFIGNFFQLLYYVVDTIVVGKYIGTEALAAVGSTGLLITVLIYFFMGFAVGAGVLVGQCFGAKDLNALHEAVQTAVAVAFILCAFLSALGYFAAEPMLRVIRIPENVLDEASVYLKVYCIGFSGVLIYYVCSEILRAVGNTMIPLIFVVFSSVLNIALDLLLVLVFGAGIEGVAWATVIAQFVSAVLTLLVLTETKEVYRLEWRGIHINPSQVKTMFRIGMPAGIQSIVTGLANLLAQSYVNALGSACMAGWSCFNKLLNISMLPTGALSSATSSFVSQNIGAKNYDRVKEGVSKVNILSAGSTALITAAMFLLAEPLTGMYTTDSEVIAFGGIFMRWIILAVTYYSVGNNLISAMIATGSSLKPIAIKLATYVGLRLLCLYVGCTLISNTPITISLAFPISWAAGTAALYIYYRRSWKDHIGLTA